MRRLLLLALASLAVLSPRAAAQVDEGVLPVDDPVQRFLQRQQTAGALDGALLTTAPFSAYEAQRMLDSLAARLDRGEVTLGSVDARLLARYRGEAPGPGAAFARRRVGSSVYGDGESLFAVDGEDYAVRVQPQIALTPGSTRRSAQAALPANEFSYLASRGGRVAGHVGPVFFDATMTENQERVGIDEWDNSTAPRHALVKHPEPGVYDYFDATGVVGYSSRLFEIRAGRERANWGFGEGSLSLSDYGAPQDHVEIRTAFWRVRYTNRYERRVRPFERGSPLAPRGYAALHQLALDLPGRVQLEVFEIIAFTDDSTNGRRSGFETAYLNPVVFYRAVEGDIGSFDNAMLGAGAAWGFAPGYRAYGQLLLDEFRAQDFFEDAWTNKWGFLLGGHLVDPGVGEHRLRGLSLRAEYTRQRPYLYSHRSEASAYVHFADPLGHAAGPNSSDLSTWAYYQPTPTIEFGAHASRTVRGRNTPTENFGADARRPYTTRVSDFDVPTLQGVRQQETILEAWGGVEVLPSMTLGAGLFYRAIDDEVDGLERYATAFASLRWGIPYETFRF